MKIEDNLRKLIEKRFGAPIRYSSHCVAIEQARIDSIRQDSIAKAELQAQESKKIDKLLKEYAECVKVIRRDYYQDGEFDYPSRFVWENFISPTYELFKKLKKMEGDMTPEQKDKFQNLSKQIKEVVG